MIPSPIVLQEKFLKKFIGKSTLSPLGEFVFYRTYSRYLTSVNRRETWLEVCKRAAEYNVSLASKHYQKIGYPVNEETLIREAEDLFESMFFTKQFVSGRTLWIGGAENEVADKYPISNFNCSFTNITSWDDFAELFYLSMVGAGVGFKCTPEMARGLPPVKTNVTLLHSTYEPVAKTHRLEKTKVVDFENGYVKIYVGDSKEGWVEALRAFFNVLTKEEFSDTRTIKISYNSVRPTGERLKTFGGTASGYEPLKEMFEKIDLVIKSKLDPTLEPLEHVKGHYYHVRPIHVLDIGNLVGQAVVVGGVRRSAQIFLMSPSDWECVLAKYGINGFHNEKQVSNHEQVKKSLANLGVTPKWLQTFDLKPRTTLYHRMMSNNSIIFEQKPPRKLLNFIFLLMQTEGEPGFWNAEEAKRRRPNWQGGNPCSEILLDSKGMCNLTTVNVSAFVEHTNGGGIEKHILDIDGLLEAQKRSARAGLRMTLVDLELSEWNVVQKRDRLIGTSLTGIQDAFSALKYSRTKQIELLKTLSKTAKDEADKYAKELRIAPPLLVTTIKPEGTLSLVAGGVSAGLHAAHSPYYIRRIRITAADPLMKVVKDLGWPAHPEVGTPGKTEEEKLKNARTMVIDFPVKSTSIKTKNDQNVGDQFDTYFNFQKYYTDHNSSNTINVKSGEWETCEQIIWDRWDEFLAVSFLAHDGGTYELAPYEEITETQYQELLKKFKPFDASLLTKYEKFETDFDLNNDACESGACPIR